MMNRFAFVKVFLLKIALRPRVLVSRDVGDAGSINPYKDATVRPPSANEYRAVLKTRKLTNVVVGRAK